MTERDAAEDARQLNPAWRLPHGGDPDLTDASARAAVVGRMAGRIAALASDLQLLALLLQDAALVRQTASGAPAVPAEASAVAGSRITDGADDPFARAEAAVRALRAALRPADARAPEEVA